MDGVKKPAEVFVQVDRRSSEFAQLQCVERIGVMIGGVLGQALLTVVADLRDDVIGRAL